MASIPQYGTGVELLLASGAGTAASPGVLSVGLAASSAAIGSATDGGPSWTSVFGVSGETVTSADATSTPLVITDAPTTGQKIVLDDIEISSAVETLITVRTTTGTKKLGQYRLPANGTIQITTRGRKKAPTANQTLEVISSAAGNIYVTATYHSEA